MRVRVTLKIELEEFCYVQANGRAKGGKGTVEDGISFILISKFEVR